MSGNSDLMELISTLTTEQLKLPGESIYTILADATEELGELSRAVRIEDAGPTKRHKTLDESATYEAIDLAICAFAVYFARGGNVGDINAYMRKKLDKWISNVERNLANDQPT